MPRSLLDEADLAAVRAAADARGGSLGVVTACLLEGGALAHAPDDPQWPDRDRLVVGSAALRSALGEAGGPAAVALDGGGRALAVAVGLAAACALDGGVCRVFCLAEGDTIDDGLCWEAAMAAAWAGPSLIAVLAVDAAGAETARGLFGAAGWRSATASASEPVEVLGALDRVSDDGAPCPGVVLAVGS